MTTIEKYFRLAQHGTSVATEIRAGITTFLTMGYILFINPQILSLTGMPAEDVAIATALGGAIATIIMGLWANYPFAGAGYGGRFRCVRLESNRLCRGPVRSGSRGAICPPVNVAYSVNNGHVVVDDGNLTNIDLGTVLERHNQLSNTLLQRAA